MDFQLTQVCGEPHLHTATLAWPVIFQLAFTSYRGRKHDEHRIEGAGEAPETGLSIAVRTRSRSRGCGEAEPQSTDNAPWIFLGPIIRAGIALESTA